jgi:hypothetical protein
MSAIGSGAQWLPTMWRAGSGERLLRSRTVGRTGSGGLGGGFGASAATVPSQAGASGVVWKDIIAEVQKLPVNCFNGVVPAKCESFCRAA